MKDIWSPEDDDAAAHIFWPITGLLVLVVVTGLLLLMLGIPLPGM